MEPLPADRRAVEAAVHSLQERLADGDPADAALQSRCEAVLSALRDAYRATPDAFSRETIEALRELSELLRQAEPEPDADAPAAEPCERRPAVPPAPTDGPEPAKRVSQKEFAKKLRHEAYLRAKEYSKTDPRQIAMKEKLRQQRRAAYQKAKERGKAMRAELKKAADEKAAAERVAKRLPHSHE